MNGEHAGDTLGALLDGELTAAEAERVRGHVAACAACAAELATVAAVRAAIRDLPAVDPPFGFYERMLVRRARWRAGFAGVAAAAAASLAVVGLSVPREQRVGPAVPRFVEAHAATASVSGDPVSQLVPIANPVSLRR